MGPAIVQSSRLSINSTIAQWAFTAKRPLPKLYRLRLKFWLEVFWGKLTFLKSSFLQKHKCLFYYLKIRVNFKKNEKNYNAQNSEVFKMVQEADKEPRTPEPG